MQGIVEGTGFNGLKVGEFKCQFCNKGPFTTLRVIYDHLKGARHAKATAPPRDEPESPTQEQSSSAKADKLDATEESADKAEEPEKVTKPPKEKGKPPWKVDREKK